MFKRDKAAARCRKNKYFLIIIGLILLSGIFLFIFLATRNCLRVSFMDVGQGDASLIQTPTGKNILIDGGPDNLVLHRLGEALPFYIRRLDYIIISHFHDDHIIGLVEILKRYRVDKIIFVSPDISSPAVDALQREIKKLNLSVINIIASANLRLDNYCSLFFINPASLNIKDNANNSLVAKLDCGNNKFLFAGDNESGAEAALVKSDFDLRADIFKASHHGSKTSNMENFLEAVSPQKIIISVGKTNRFGHPSPEVLDRVLGRGIDIWRTDIQGTSLILAEIR
ncbi:MAG: MBL fold metallo-hydrolase [Candidatus Falkowbacteria bacterium]|nr:MAG: MBL fold metallo-hydrolase [Candidatus Falkowbacteria bacterium]